MMSGFKTWLAAAAIAVPAIFTLFTIGSACMVDTATCDGDGLQAAWLQLSAALATVGIGHKIEKAGNA